MGKKEKKIFVWRLRGTLFQSQQLELWYCAAPVKSRWMSDGSLAPLLVNRWCWGLSSISIVGSSGFACGTGTPETGRTQQEQEQSQNHPSHHNQGEGQVTTSSTSSDWPTWAWQFQWALCVCAVGLRLPEQVDEAPHSILMGADALTRVKASLGHVSQDGVHLC